MVYEYKLYFMTHTHKKIFQIAKNILIGIVKYAVVFIASVLFVGMVETLLFNFR